MVESDDQIEDGFGFGGDLPEGDAGAGVGCAAKGERGSVGDNLRW